jgi:hypothetical protein
MKGINILLRSYAYELNEPLGVRSGGVVVSINRFVRM